MITKYKQFNESIKNLLVGPTKEEVFKSLDFDRVFDTPEEFFLNIIDGMKIKEQNIYPNSIFWEKDGKLLFEQSLISKKLYFSYKYIMRILEVVFGLGYNDIIIFIESQLTYLNWIGFIPTPIEYHDYIRWNKI